MFSISDPTGKKISFRNSSSVLVFRKFGSISDNSDEAGIESGILEYCLEEVIFYILQPISIRSYIPILL